MAGENDAKHLEYAAAQGLVLYSFNRGDYAALHTMFMEQGLSHGGIILSRHNRHSVGEQMRRLVRLADALSAEEMKDRIEYLNAWGD